MILNDVDDLCNQRTRLPSESTAGLQDNVEIRIALMELTHHVYEQVDVIILTCHEMSATEVYPFQLREPLRELFLDVLKGTPEDVGTTLTMAVAMESGYVGRQGLRQLVGGDAEPGAGSARVVEQSPDLTVFRVNPKTELQLRVNLECTFMETPVLSERIERYVGRVS